jgi:hypothetical protein
MGQHPAIFNLPGNKVAFFPHSFESMSGGVFWIDQFGLFEIRFGITGVSLVRLLK